MGDSSKIVVLRGSSWDTESIARLERKVAQFCNQIGLPEKQITTHAPQILDWNDSNCQFFDADVAQAYVVNPRWRYYSAWGHPLGPAALILALLVFLDSDKAYRVLYGADGMTAPYEEISPSLVKELALGSAIQNQHALV